MTEARPEPSFPAPPELADDGDEEETGAVENEVVVDLFTGRPGRDEDHPPPPGRIIKGRLTVFGPNGQALAAAAGDKGASSHGLLEMEADGTFAFRVPGGFTGRDSFVYRVDDGGGDWWTGIGRVLVPGTADAPFLAVVEGLGWQGADIPLCIAVATPRPAELRILLGHLPEGARPSLGVPEEEGFWSVAAEDVADLSIRPPRDFAGAFTLGVTPWDPETGRVWPSLPLVVRVLSATVLEEEPTPVEPPKPPAEEPAPPPVIAPSPPEARLPNVNAEATSTMLGRWVRNEPGVRELVARHEIWLASGEGEPLIRENMDLRGVDLSGANLSGAVLRGADFSRARMAGAQLILADLSGANLHGADCRWANMRGVALADADLTGADLRGVDLGSAPVGRKDGRMTTRTADLSGARLEGARLEGVRIMGARLDGASGIPSDLLAESLKGRPGV